MGAPGVGSDVSIQHRRLAEFATFLGDYKLAVTVWEALRKETKGVYGSVRLTYLVKALLFTPYLGHPAATIKPVTRAPTSCIERPIFTFL